ncbi:hypothetical protein ACIRG5_30425 [Lentzea sp. NPDC102401]|uniref:hypothetical protein n=1 Tax=Lentzea sp. NPDC102401 TaxID=3364128 RepID=UPI0037FBD08D
MNTWVLPDDVRLSELLAFFEFDVTRAKAELGASIESGLPLEPVAGDFSGGQYYLCGDAGSGRPVLYASSEGQAGLIANNLREAVELVVGLPCWHDCLTFADFEPKPLTRTSHQDEAAQLLALKLPAQEVLLARLRAAVLRSTSGYVFRDETGEYEGL